MASVEGHGNRFRAVWRENGITRRRSFDTKDEARAFADNFLATIGRGDIDISPLVAVMLDRHRPSPTVIEFAGPSSRMQTSGRRLVTSIATHCARSMAPRSARRP